MVAAHLGSGASMPCGARDRQGPNGPLRYSIGSLRTRSRTPPPGRQSREGETLGQPEGFSLRALVLKRGRSRAHASARSHARHDRASREGKRAACEGWPYPDGQMAWRSPRRPRRRAPRCVARYAGWFWPARRNRMR